MPTTTEIRTELVWTPEAWEQFQTIRTQAHTIGANWGQTLGDRAHASIGHCLAGVLASGPTNVYQDHDGLLFVTPYITMGMVFHADTADWMAASLSSTTSCPHTADEVAAAFRHAPPSGEWSLHS